MADRRTFLRGLAVLPVVSTAQAEPPREDPVIVARRDWLVARARYAASPDDTPNEVEEALWEAADQAELRAIQARPRTIAGAVAALEWAHAEMDQHHGTSVHGDQLILNLMDGALGLLRMLEARHG